MNVSGPESILRSIEMVNNLNKTIVDQSQELDNKLVKAAVGEQVQKAKSQNQIDLLA